MAASLSGEDIEALYAERPDGFVAARSALAGRLKDEGKPEAAREATALRRPTVAAWAVNRLARDRKGDLQALLEAGQRLRGAQARAVAGKGASAMQEAGRERRRLVDRLVAEAAKTLSREGMSSARATLDKVADTLMAMAVDDEAAERIRRGTLEHELAGPAGFGEGEEGDEGLEALLSASTAATASTRPATAKRPAGKRTGRAGPGPVAPPSPAQQRRERQARERAERLAAEAEAALDDARRLEGEAKEADRASREADSEAERARRRAERAHKAAAEARQRADRARKRAEGAAGI